MGAPNTSLHGLADAAGLSRVWQDVSGGRNTVGDDTLAAILTALGYACDGDASIAESIAAIRDEQHTLPRLVSGEVGLDIALPIDAGRAEIIAEDGERRVVEIVGGVMPPVAAPGFYRLIIGDREIVCAVAPRHCPLPTSNRHGRIWGPALQIPALRGPAASPYGDFGTLHDAVQAFARRGADAVAISPVHAMFPGQGTRFSPYSPSSRRFINTALGDPALVGLPPLPRSTGGAFIDWEAALPHRQEQLRALFASLDAATRRRLSDDVAALGEPFRHQAIFDALYCRFQPQGARDWRDWPEPFRHPETPEVRRFATDNAGEVDFHLFAQWLARESLARVQGGARAAGMGVGLVADLAVGVDPGGSDAWSMRHAMLSGLTIGAPPDPLGPLGQNWALTSFSPRGLNATGFAPWIAMLRAALSHSGGVRIDHAFGLSRLWVIPEGETSAGGAYLSYPFTTLMRLATLEAHRADACVIAEDLGTAPPGFGAAMKDSRMLGMSVLWFQRAADHGFIGAQDYPPMSVAMTGTHDTPTVAGWWRGRDLDWAEQLDRLPPDCDRAQADAIRARDRGLLWATIGDGGPRPAPDDPDPVVDAAIAHVARAPSILAITPVEDLLALVEQPNLPGTVTEHPNWRRRLDAPMETLLDDPAVAARIDILSGSDDGWSGFTSD